MINKQQVKIILLAAALNLSGLGAWAGELTIEQATEFVLLPNRQIEFRYDEDGDGTTDTVTRHASVAFIGHPTAFADVDPRYIWVPRDGVYLVVKAPDGGAVSLARPNPCGEVP